MEVENQNGEAPQKFPAFPYKPYAIQMDFMNALYHSLNQGGLSMLESPTGTGKTLSIICSALQWVVDKRERDKLRKEVENESSSAKGGELGSDDEPDCMRNAVVNKDIQEEEKSRKKDKFGGGFRRSDKRKSSHGNCSDLFTRRVEEEVCREKEGKVLQVGSDAVELNDEDEFLLDEHESDEEGVPCVGKSKRKAAGVSLSLSSDEEDGADGSSDDEDKGEEEKLKVYFCSRTHSQLSQFIKELRKTVFADEMKVVCLGSRKNLCINHEVLKLGNSTRINERCLELQKNKNNKNKEVSKIKEEGFAGTRLLADAQ